MDERASNIRTERANLEVVDPLRQYLNGIGRVALLNAEQEVEIAKRIEAGVYAQHLHDEADGRFSDSELLELSEDGRQAKEELMTANLRLVVSIAKRYQGKNMPLLDIIQEGNLGLNRAVEKFDYAKGYKFSTYATWWIRQAITRSLADQGRTIRLPVHLVEQVNKIARVRRELHTQLNREPNLEEIAQETGIDADKIVDIEHFAREPVSLNAPVGDEDAELGDFLADENGLDVAETVYRNTIGEQVEKIFTTAGLEDKEKQVIRMRFGIGTESMTLDAIGKVLGVSRERIRQIERHALGKLRDTPAARALATEYNIESA